MFAHKTPTYTEEAGDVRLTDKQHTGFFADFLIGISLCDAALIGAVIFVHLFDMLNADMAVHAIPLVCMPTNIIQRIVVQKNLDNIYHGLH